MKILVTGGNGMLGKHLKEYLPNATYLSSKDFDLKSKAEVVKMYKFHKPDFVIHLAAKVGGIFDNINKPTEYLEDNILMNTFVVKYAHKFGVKNLIGILSTCIYPDQVEDSEYPMKENLLHAGPPTKTNFGYGYSKRLLAVQIDTYREKYCVNYSYLIPSNLYSEHDDFSNERKMHFVTALLKKIHLANKNKDTELQLFGDGIPLRQFMYAGDLAEIIAKSVNEMIFTNMNVSDNNNISIDQIARIALKATNSEHLKINYDKSKPNGQYRKDVSNDLLLKTFPDFKFSSMEQKFREIYSLLTSKEEDW